MAYGSIGTDQIVTSVPGVSLGAGNASIMKNRLINSAMVIDQRNAGASVTPTTSSTYTLDRWCVLLSAASKFSVQQSTTAPAGFVNSAKITSLSAYSVGSGDYFAFTQRIEGFNTADLGWGTVNAKTITISAWVQSSLTGTFGGSIRNGAGNRSYPFTYSILVANTWTPIAITIAGDTTGTWATDNSESMEIDFGLGVGSTYSGTAGSWAGANYVSATGATSVVGTNGATFYITGVQLEVGSSATGYEYRLYQQELALCQRYYTADANGYSLVCSGSNYCSTAFKVSMRATPTVTATPGSGSFSGLVANTLGFQGTNSTTAAIAYTATAEL
jgi:hypothetical protein